MHTHFPGWTMLNIRRHIPTGCDKTGLNTDEMYIGLTDNLFMRKETMYTNIGLEMKTIYAITLRHHITTFEDNTKSYSLNLTKFSQS